MQKVYFSRIVYQSLLFVAVITLIVLMGRIIPVIYNNDDYLFYNLSETTGIYAYCIVLFMSIGCIILGYMLRKSIELLAVPVMFAGIFCLSYATVVSYSFVYIDGFYSKTARELGQVLLIFTLAIDWFLLCWSLWKRNRESINILS